MMLRDVLGSHAPRSDSTLVLFLLLSLISLRVPVVPADPEIFAPRVTIVVLPSGVLDLVDYSPSSDSDPSEDSLPPAPDLSLVSPFLCFNDTEADSESEPAEQRPVSSSHDTLAPLSEFPLAPVVALPGIHRRSMALVRPGEAIPFGRPYRTHPNGPRKLLTARKRVRPISAHRLAWRYVSYHLSDCHSLPDSSSSSAPLDHSLSGHTPPMLIHLHHRDLFIDHLLGLHDIVMRIVSLRGSEVRSLCDSRVDGRSYLLSGATNSSEANGIIQNPKLELEYYLEVDVEIENSYVMSPYGVHGMK
ncbi:hypothetical protein Tco_0638239 [Tanacetum coccineum]